MLLHKHMTRSGTWLFSRRGWFLLLFLPVLILAFPREAWMERAFGDVIEDGYEVFCLALIAGGLGVRALTVGFVPGKTSGRNVGGQVALVLNTTGAYSLCRNPLYVGNMMIYLGVVMLTQNLVLSLVFAALLALYYERIVLAEEAFLADHFGREYLDWAARVPAFVPRFSGWTPPELPFCFRTVLRRENPGWYGAVVAAIAVSAAVEIVAEHEAVEPATLWQLAAATALFLGIEALRRGTSVLKAPGR